jgi:hypothetical protein
VKFHYETPKAYAGQLSLQTVNLVGQAQHLLFLKRQKVMAFMQ